MLFITDRVYVCHGRALISEIRFWACLILDPPCSVLDRSSLGSQVSWLPACFGTCEEALVIGEEEDGKEKLSVSPVSLPGVLSSMVRLLFGSCAHCTGPQVPVVVRWPSTGPRKPPLLLLISGLSLSSSLYQLNNHFLELFSLLETPEGLPVALVISRLIHWSSCWTKGAMWPPVVLGWDS